MVLLLAGAIAAGLTAALSVGSGSVVLGLADNLRGVAQLAAPDRPEANLAVVGEPVYSLDLVGSDGKHLFVNATQAAAAGAEQEGRTTRVRFTAAEAHPADVVCSFEAAEDGSIRCWIEVRPAQGVAVAAISFPVVHVRLPLGGEGADDQLVVPMYDGALVPNPAERLARGANWTGAYPGSLGAQFLAVGDPEQGVYMACQDPEGHTKSMSYRRSDDGLRLAATHLQSLEPGKAVAVAYPVVVRTYRGNWMAAADLYKAWATRQPWCARTLAQRDDIPEWVKRGPFFHAVSMRNQGQDGKWVNFLGSLPGYIRRYHEALDWPVCAMIMAWEKQGPWVTPDYFPPFGGEEAFRKATQAVLAQGDHTLVFLSGLKWTLEKTRDSDYSSRAQFDERGRAQAVVGEDGKVQQWGKPDEGVGQYAQVCPATPLAREVLVGTTLECVDLGIQCVQVDQVVGGAMPPCYSGEHGHPRGSGQWLARAVYNVFSETVKAGKEHNPDYAFAIEEPHELFIPLLDCYHARDYQFGRWPRGGPGNPYPIPLFAYLYHEYCLGYGGDSASLSTRPSPYLSLAQAINALTGKTPGGCVWTRALEAEQVDPTILGFTKQHCALLRAGAGKWLLMGRMVDWDFVGGPTVTMKLESGEFGFRAVQSSAWVAEDGSQAWLVANITGEERAVKVELRGYGAGEGAPVEITVRTGDGSVAAGQGGRVRLPGEIELTVPAHGLVLATSARA